MKERSKKDVLDRIRVKHCNDHPYIFSYLQPNNCRLYYALYKGFLDVGKTPLEAYQNVLRKYNENFGF